MSNPITIEQVEEAVRSVVGRFPDSINPKGAGVYTDWCVYTSPGDPDCHCLVGQVIIDLGGSVPGADSNWNSFGVDYMLKHFDTGLEFTDTATLALSFCQDDADHAALSTWGSIRADLERSFVLAREFRVQTAPSFP